MVKIFPKIRTNFIANLICMSLKLKDTVYSYCRNADGSYRDMTEEEQKAFKPRYAAGAYGNWVDLETGKEMPDGWQPSNVVPEN